ncbi:hypothetical protein G5V57_32490 [Nordella sp. HKS 07]|uniref:SRPBCC family protein n=1 Tax=Nordella sp. HKS 07 TaxID=2712222 RepID=UPI0013E1BFBD|nr:SRPBCC family protein [Nordella sp. HKS 07]QIG52007.1 hypothetical protein G5V57_32490 [Nordella sp. HKS 07]
MKAGQSHITSAVVKAEARSVFARMADAQKLHRWSFGTWKTEIGEDGLVRGTSLFDGSSIHLRIDAYETRHIIDYHLGVDPQKLVPRIQVRVVPGEHVGLDSGHSVLTFIAWRSEAMDDDRWRRLTASHEMEVMLIKAMIESGQF